MPTSFRELNVTWVPSVEKISEINMVDTYILLVRTKPPLKAAYTAKLSYRHNIL